MIVYNIILSIGIFFFVLSGLFFGVWTTGDRQRANFYTETKENRRFRERISLWCGVVGIICLGLAGIIHFVK